MNIFAFFYFREFYQNILQNAPNCTILKKFLGGACPEPPSKHVVSPRAAWPHFSKKYFVAPPPPK